MSTIRNLVSIRRISNKRPVKKTQYEQIFVDGWSVVAHQGEGYEVGQLVVYFEIDSFVPASDARLWEYSGSFTEYNGQKGYHVRSYVVRGQLSQGLMFRLEAYPEVQHVLDHLRAENGEKEGTRQAMLVKFERVLGVVKWEPPVDMAEKGVLGRPPTFFPMPGCPRAQNCPWLFDPRHINTTYQMTEKLDGLSMAVYHVERGSVWDRDLPELPEGPATAALTATGGRIGVCGHRADLLADENNMFWRAAKTSGVLDHITKFGRPNVVVLGELCGDGVLTNGLGLPKGVQKFYIFDIYDIDRRARLRVEDTVTICKHLKLAHVPVLGYVQMRNFAHGGLEELLKKAEGLGFMGQNREGFILKTMRNDQSVKVISNSWLLEKGM